MDEWPQSNEGAVLGPLILALIVVGIVWLAT